VTAQQRTPTAGEWRETSDEPRAQTEQAAKLDALIWANLKEIGYGE
jgi:hypothetical protein